MRALVTGGAGFIGSHIAEAMLARGDEVTVIDNLTTGRRENVPDGARFAHGDVALMADWWAAEPLDVIYHCAASYADPSDWEGDAHNNVLGTIAAVREAQRTGARLVYFQTSLCYGLSPRTPVRLDAPLDPRGSYAVTKTAAEALIRDSGVPWVSLRLANMYGPRNLSGPLPVFWSRLSRGEPCAVVDSRRDYVHVDDLVRVAVEAASHGSGAYHVASGGDQPVSEVYHAVRAAMGLPPAPAPMRPRGPDDAATILLDPSRTEEEFGWEATTGLWPGARTAVRWYERHGVERTFTHLRMEDSPREAVPR